MPAFTVPPLPGETLLTIIDVAEHANCSRQAIYNALRDGKISGVLVAGRTLIAESEAERFIREWPVRPNGQAVAARWHEFRQWKAAQRGQVVPMVSA
jgi:hypothetical protein